MNTFLTMASALIRIVFLQFLYIVSVPGYDQLITPGVTIAITSTTYLQHNASLAVDGDHTQDIDHCLHTDARSTITEAWFRIDLKRIYSLKSVKFWYRNGGTERKRLLGYSIRVSNDSARPPPESICYQDPGNAILPSIIEKDCERTAQYVWIYQNNKIAGEICPMLEICEVQIFGCDTGKFKESCNEVCDHCQNRDHCGIASGICDASGCANRNFHPPMCEECIPGMYGSECAYQCSAFCQNKTCDRNTGACLRGCVPGYRGSNCNQTCPSGTYGYDCRGLCGYCFQKQACSHTDGSCHDGCNEGFKGKLCNIPCSAWEYGINCMFNCSGNCLSSYICDKYTGACNNCSSGYEGPKCDRQCVHGMYGMKCAFKCENCVKSTNCNHTNGKCSLGCAPGWQTSDKCGIPCKNGTYGMNCMYNCSGFCPNGGFCDKIDGSCPEEDYDNNQIKAETIVIVVVLFLILIIVGVVVMFLYRKNARNQSSQKTEDDTVYHLPDIVKDENEYDELSTYEETESNHYQQPVSPINQRDMPQSVKKQPKAPQSQPTVVMIPDLLSRIKALEQHSNRGFLREYEAINADVSDCSCKFGRLRENLSKNTHATTLPYDHSRVVLQSTPDNYVNTSFVKNMNGEKTYIASQEPNRNTASNFWQMVWQENANVIAMTVLMSDCQQRKTQKYWPDSTASDMNQRAFVIHLQSEKTYSTFTIRDFQLIKKETRENRQIRHLQFTAWPERGMPRPLDLLVYYRYVSRAMEKHSESTLLVQCRVSTSAITML